MDQSLPHILGADQLEQSFERKKSEIENSGFEIINSHCGILNEMIVNDLAYTTEKILKDRACKKPFVKRIFSLLVELVQNIFLHGEYEEDQKLAYLIVAMKDENIVISSANVSSIVKEIKISAKIKKINALDRDGLKEYYLEVLTNGEISDKGGAGLGFITISMKAKNNLDFEFDKIDGQFSLFKLETVING